MEVVITHEHLKNALNIVSKVSIKRNELPILANVLIKVSSSVIEFTTTNLETAISHKVVGKIIEEGSITIPVKLFTSYINSLPSDNITLRVENNNLSISTKQFNSTINGISAEDFPILPILDSGNEVVIEGGALKDFLNRSIIASSHDDSRPILNGVHIVFSEEGVIFAATDGYRLSEIKTNLKSSFSETVTVPNQTIQEVLYVVGEGDVTVSFDENQIQFSTGDSIVISKLLSGEYPEYDKLIPHSSENTIVIKKDDLLNIAKIANLFSKESAGAITIESDENTQKVKVSSVATQVGDNESNVEAAIKGSGAVTINSQYLIDALPSFDCEDVSYRFSGKLNPTILERYDPEGNTSNQLHVIMPLKS